MGGFPRKGTFHGRFRKNSSVTCAFLSSITNTTSQFCHFVHPMGSAAHRYFFIKGKSFKYDVVLVDGKEIVRP